MSLETQRGASLLEGIIALAIIGIAILVAAAFLDSQAITAERVRAQRELVRQLEAAIEGARAGGFAMQSGAITPMPMSTEVEQLVVSQQVVARHPPGLYEVTFRVGCRTRRGPLSRSVTTMIWRPP